MTDLRDQTGGISVARSSAAVFMQQVYLWMTAGLGVTALAAYFTSRSPEMLQFFFGGTVRVVIFAVAIFGLVMFLSAGMHKLSKTAATGFFLLYAALNGIFLGPVLLVYTQASVAQAFFVSAGMFGAMSIFGAVTKRDLTGMGNFMMLGLFGIIIAMIVNIFLKSSALDLGISIIGVIVFAGLTAWDTQKLRSMGASAPLEDGTAVRRGAILGALTLYLDFINMFLMLLRIFGNRE